MQKISVFGEFNKNIYFSAKSAEKSTIYDKLFFVAIYSPENDNIHPSKKRNQHWSEQLLYYKWSFSRFGTHFDERPKMLTYSQISKKYFLLANCPTKDTS